jgi:hypothetical protein
VPPETKLAAKRARQAPSHRVSVPVAAISPAHLIRSHVSQAFNSYVYRENLKKRVKAGSPKALRAQHKELEREEKKSNKRKAARELAARARPQPPPPKQKKCTAGGQRRAVRDGQCEIVPGQCEGTCKDGKRCRIGPGSFPCAKPLNLGSEACSKSAASAAQGCSVLGPAAQAHFQIPPRLTVFVTQARVSGFCGVVCNANAGKGKIKAKPFQARLYVISSSSHKRARVNRGSFGSAEEAALHYAWLLKHESNSYSASPS